jgi:hypothetical protein
MRTLSDTISIILKRKETYGLLSSPLIQTPQLYSHRTDQSKSWQMNEGLQQLDYPVGIEFWQLKCKMTIMSHQIFVHNMLNIYLRTIVLTFKWICDCNLRGTSAGPRYDCWNTLHLFEVVSEYVLDLVEKIANLLPWILRGILHRDSHAYSVSISISRRKTSSNFCSD